MQTDWELISNFSVALLAIVNPIEKIPLWVEASRGDSRHFRWLLGGLIMLSSAVILLLFLWFGRRLLVELQIDLASFKIGGGLILLQFGFSMLNGSAIDINSESLDRSESLKTRVLTRYRQIFIPIGMPVIAGPGAITTVIIYGYQSDSLLTSAMLSLTVAGVLLLLYLILLTGPYIQSWIGNLPLTLISRVFGMILIAIAVQFMADGLKVVFPGWSRGG
ncbi:MAG: MarC family protein [Desulfobacterales bacterium]